MRKQYADDSAEKAALEQMKGQVVLQLIWWCTLVSLICLRAYDYLPSFVNSEIGLNCILWLFLALIRSEKEASRDQVPRDHTPTDLGTQFLGAVDQVTTDLDHDDDATVAFEGTPKFISLSEKIARRRAANERLSVSEHRMHELKSEFISEPQWDTFRAFDFRHEYEDYLGDVLSDGAEGSLMEFFDEMVVALTAFAPKEFGDEFYELARPRPGDPANIQAPTYKGWPATKDGRYTDCLIRMRQGDVGYLRSRPSGGDDIMRSDDVRVDLDRAEKMDKRLRECEARHDDIKNAQALLARFAALRENRPDEHAYDYKAVVLLTLVSAFCFWLGDESDDLALNGDDAVSHKLRNIKSDVLDSSNELVSTLGLGSELFTWMAYFLASVVMWMVWRLTLAMWRRSGLRKWCDKQTCWKWITCRSNRASEDEALAKEVDCFFSAGAPSDDPLLSGDDDMHGGGASKRVGINTDESSNIFPLAKYSSTLPSPFPSKHKWEAEQAKAYLLGHHDLEHDPEVREKRKKRSAMTMQEQNENPPRERCRNVIKMLKLERDLDRAVLVYSEKTEVCGSVDSKQRNALLEMHRIQKFTEEVNRLASKDIDISSGTDAAQLAAEFDDLMQPPRRLTPGEAKLQLATWIDLQQWW